MALVRPNTPTHTHHTIHSHTHTHTQEVLGYDVWICAPEGGQYYQQSCTERLVIDAHPGVFASSAYYSYVFDTASHTYLFPTVLATTGAFPKPGAFASVAYNDRTNVRKHACV